MPKYEYNIGNIPEGLLIMFKYIDPHVTSSHMGCDVNMKFEPMDDEEGGWFLTEFECGNPSISEIANMIIKIFKELQKEDIVTFTQLIQFCNRVGKENPAIFSDAFPEAGG